MGRFCLDPAIETAQLFNNDDDILSVLLTEDQNVIRKDRIKETLKVALEEEMQWQICSIGVDINRCARDNHIAGCLQFVAGLGPRKADGLIKYYRKENRRLESLEQLIKDYTYFDRRTVNIQLKKSLPFVRQFCVRDCILWRVSRAANPRTANVQINSLSSAGIMRHCTHY